MVLGVHSDLSILYHVQIMIIQITAADCGLEPAFFTIQTKDHG